MSAPAVVSSGRPAADPPRASEAGFAHLVRSEWRAVVVLLGVALLLWLPRLRGPLDLRWDGGVYYVLGTALAQGHGYRLLNEPGAIAATQYPPLLPLIVAAAQRVMGTSDHVVVAHVLRLLSFVVFLVQTVCVYCLMRRKLPSGYAFAATAIFLLNVFTFFLSDLCFPEMWFGLCSVVFVLLIEKDRGRRRSGAFTAGGAAVAAVAAYALRTVGIALLAAWVVEAALKRQPRLFVGRALIGLTTVLCWQFYTRAVESSAEYKQTAYPYQRADYQFYNVSYTRNIALKDPFAPEQGYLRLPDIAERFARNLVLAPIKLGEAVSIKVGFEIFQSEPFRSNVFFSRYLPILANAAACVLGLLVVGGLVIQAVERQWMVPLYCALYIFVVCGTPWPQQFNRYLAPLSPFLILSLFGCLLALQRRWRNAPGRTARFVGAYLPAGVTGVVILSELAAVGLLFALKHRTVNYQHANKRVTYKLFFYLEPYQALDSCIDWLGKHAEPSAITAVSMPHWVYIRTGRQAVLPPFESDPEKAQRLLDSVPVTYLFADKGLALDTLKYTLPVVQRYPNRWRLVYSVPQSGVSVYQRVR